MQKALAELDQSIKLDGKMPAGVLNRGLTLRNRNDVDQPSPTSTARSSSIQATRSRSTRAATPICPERDFGRPIADLDQVIKLNPRFRRGLCRPRRSLWHGRRPPGNRRFRPGDQARSERRARFSNRGFAWRTQGDIVRAAADYDSTIKLDVGNALACSTIQETPITRSANFGRAIADFDQALKINPTYSALALYNRRPCAARQGRADRAIADFARLPS